MKKTRSASSLELSWLTIIILALLPIGRVIGHDLQIVKPETYLNFLLAIVPLILWVVVVLYKKVRSPLINLLVVGAVFGIFLALTHQIFWDGFWAGREPSLGNLEGKLSPLAEEVVTRSAAFISSVLTGIVTGGIMGLIAMLLQRVTQKPSAR